MHPPGRGLWDPRRACSPGACVRVIYRRMALTPFPNLLSPDALWLSHGVPASEDTPWDDASPPAAPPGPVGPPPDETRSPSESPRPARRRPRRPPDPTRLGTPPGSAAPLARSTAAA